MRNVHLEKLAGSGLPDFWYTRPVINLLVECKQSELPYVFFLRDKAPTEYLEHPEIAGLRDTKIRYLISDDREPFSTTISVRDVIHLSDLPFFGRQKHFAISMSRMARRGKKLELTGEDAYRSITLPLLKAADHLKVVTLPEKEQLNYDMRFVICLAVIRAPMYGSTLQDGKHELIPVPWVRACRLEPHGSGGSLWNDPSSMVRYMDVVHESHLPVYLKDLWRDFNIAGDRVRQVAKVIAQGRGIVLDPFYAPLYDNILPVSQENPWPHRDDASESL